MKAPKQAQCHTSTLYASPKLAQCHQMKAPKLAQRHASATQGSQTSSVLAKYMKTPNCFSVRPVQHTKAPGQARYHASAMHECSYMSSETSESN